MPFKFGMRALPRQQRRVRARRLDGERAVVRAHQPEHVAHGERAQVDLRHVLEDEAGDVVPSVKKRVQRSGSAWLAGCEVDDLGADVQPELHALQRGGPLHPLGERLERLLVGGLRRQSRRRDDQTRSRPA